MFEKMDKNEVESGDFVVQTLESVLNIDEGSDLFNDKTVRGINHRRRTLLNTKCNFVLLNEANESKVEVASTSKIKTSPQKIKISPQVNWSKKASKFVLN